MQSRFYYSIFITLGLLVVLMLFLAFKYIKSPQSSVPLVVETAGMDDTTTILNHESLKNSWLGHVKKDLNQKSYFYAVSEIQLELH
jgi:hypothetical protein